MLLFCSEVHTLFFFFIPSYLPVLSPISSNKKKHLTIFSSQNEKDLKDQFQLFVCEPITCEQQEKEEEGEKKTHYLTSLVSFGRIFD